MTLESVSPSGSLEGQGLTQKGEQTRARILEVALALFLERGYDRATMREIAKQAGVSLGSAYYYFRSKEHLIQGYYAQSHRDHLQACRQILEQEKTLENRLKKVLDAKIVTSEPYHQFAGTLFKTAADPNSPLSPFSPESQPTRRQATQLMAEVVEGSDVKAPDGLAKELPNLLWLYLMGVILFWIHDRSPGCTRTFLLIDHTSRLVAKLIRLARNPLLRPLTHRTLEMLKDFQDYR